MSGILRISRQARTSYVFKATKRASSPATANPKWLLTTSENAGRRFLTLATRVNDDVDELLNLDMELHHRDQLIVSAPASRAAFRTRSIGPCGVCRTQTIS